MVPQNSLIPQFVFVSLVDELLLWFFLVYLLVLWDEILLPFVHKSRGVILMRLEHAGKIQSASLISAADPELEAEVLEAAQG